MTGHVIEVGCSKFAMTSSARKHQPPMSACTIVLPGFGGGGRVKYGAPFGIAATAFGDFEWSFAYSRE